MISNRSPFYGAPYGDSLNDAKLSTLQSLLQAQLSQNGGKIELIDPARTARLVELSFNHLEGMQNKRLILNKHLILTPSQIQSLAKLAEECGAVTSEITPHWFDGNETTPCHYGLAVTHDAGISTRLYCEYETASDAPPHQQRIINELAHLRVRLSKLNIFIDTGNPVFADLDPAEQERLREQATHMARYVDVLESRIAHF